jgi:hypothetical protein
LEIGFVLDRSLYQCRSSPICLRVGLTHLCNSQNVRNCSKDAFH